MRAAEENPVRSAECLLSLLDERDDEGPGYHRRVAGARLIAGAMRDLRILRRALTKAS